MNVSVVMITYGHEKFIAEAINGVLMQECDFEVELIIANDCSPDKTDEIIQNIIANHPRTSWIKYTKHEKNLGMMSNFIVAMQECQGKYIALCEGDDYWTDPLKLQKQVDFLEGNEDCNICFHRSYLLKDSSLVLHEVPSPFENTTFYYIELLRHFNFMLTASVVFRKPHKNILPEWFSKMPFGDLALYKIVSQDKKIGCIDETMSVYRVHENGVWSVLKPIEAVIQYLNFYKKIYFYLSKEEKIIVSDKIKKNLFQVSKLKYPKNAIMNKMYYYFQLMKFNKYLTLH